MFASSDIRLKDGKKKKKKEEKSVKSKDKNSKAVDKVIKKFTNVIEISDSDTTRDTTMSNNKTFDECVDEEFNYNSVQKIEVMHGQKIDYMSFDYYNK